MGAGEGHYPIPPPPPICGMTSEQTMHAICLGNDNGSLETNQPTVHGCVPAHMLYGSQHKSLRNAIFALLLKYYHL